jgi:hypothetical protein
VVDHGPLMMPRPCWVRGVAYQRPGGPRGERLGGKPSMYGRGKSDRPVVPAKPPNKLAVVARAEVVEERGLPGGNAVSETRPGLRAGLGVSTCLARVRRWSGANPTLGRSPVR